MLRLLVSVATILAVTANDCSYFTNTIKTCDEPEWAGEGNCMMAVRTNGKTCNDYCQSQGSTCIRAQDNKRSNVCGRDLSHEEGCDKKWGDQICVCADPCEQYSNKIKVCTDEPEWAGEGNCMIAVKTNQKTCNDYCTSQGATCVRAQDNTRRNVCRRDESHAEGCNEKWGDQICVCSKSIEAEVGFFFGKKPSNDRPEIGELCGHPLLGYCVSSSGSKITSGMTKASGSDYWSQVQCVEWCEKQSGISGCEFIWNQPERGCWKHTAPVSGGNEVENQHICYKCGNGAVPGCTDSTATNYNAEATENDGSCNYPVLGCTDASATNYNAAATRDDGSCKHATCGAECRKWMKTYTCDDLLAYGMQCEAENCDCDAALECSADCKTWLEHYSCDKLKEFGMNCDSCDCTPKCPKTCTDYFKYYSCGGLMEQGIDCSDCSECSCSQCGVYMSNYSCSQLKESFNMDCSDCVECA